MEDAVRSGRFYYDVMYTVCTHTLTYTRTDGAVAKSYRTNGLLIYGG